MIGILPQNPQALFVKKTVREDLLEIFLGRKVSKEGKETRLRHVSRLCRVDTLLTSHPYDLSGGEQQRAALAKILLLRPRILLLDEPTKGLDYKRVAIVEELFTRMKGHTILCVSHDLRFAAKVADRIVVIYSAEQVEEADAADFFSEPLHPYSKALIKALPENGMNITEGYASESEKSGTGGCRFSSRCPMRMEKCMLPPPIVHIGSGKVRCHGYAATDGKYHTHVH
jgi:peptide/nickel transport system ATP-binding protein